MPEHGLGQNPHEIDLYTEGERARDEDTESRLNIPQFEFVTNDGNNRSQIRRHAMRESWRQRNRGRSNSPVNRTPPRQRKLLPGRSRRRQQGSNAGQEGDSAEISDADFTEDARQSDHSSEGDTRLAQQHEEMVGHGSQSRDRIFVDLRHTMVPISSSHSNKWSMSAVPSYSGQRPSPYQSIRDAEPDPFAPIKLSRADKELMYHWVRVYAHQAFGVPTDPVFDPIGGLYATIDLAHPAAVHASLAHSASHLAYLRQERDISVQAIAHKMAAIQLINQSLNDPVKAISDENFSAVCRILTFERYWGTEPAWKLHRKGLAQMIKKRGGLSTFRSNWNLELRVHLISLMPIPSWNKPVFATESQSASRSISEAPFDVLQDYETPHSNFVSFFSEITTISQEITERYPAITRAILLLRFITTPAQDMDRLICLFYLAFTFKHARRSHYDLSLLNDSLSMTEHIWTKSLETLRWLLQQGMGRGPEVPESLARTEKLAILALLLQENSWRSLEDRYCTLLLGGSPNGIEPDPWASNIFNGHDYD